MKTTEQAWQSVVKIQRPDGVTSFVYAFTPHGALERLTEKLKARLEAPSVSDQKRRRPR